MIYLALGRSDLSAKKHSINDMPVAIGTIMHEDALRMPKNSLT